MKALRCAVCALLLVSVCVSFIGCGGKIYAEDLMRGVKAAEMTEADELDFGNSAAFAFSAELYKQSYAENSVISPLSVLFALSMLQNGAGGKTQEEFESALGMTKDQANLYAYSYLKSLKNTDKCKLKVANSLWIRDIEELTVKEAFLKTNANYHSAAVYRAPFDRTTVKDINTWISKNTDNLIRNMLQDIPDEAVMYLVNALAFFGEWESVYEKTAVREDYFYLENGGSMTAEFMYSNEGRYIETEGASGFMKSYKGGDYAFVALLPDEGITVSDYIASLSPEQLYLDIRAASAASVRASIPKFELEYELDLRSALMSLGITDAFDREAADFSGIGSSRRGNLSVGRVQHKAYIKVAERGTEAGAATIVEVLDGAADSPDEVAVHLNRPFVFMIIDTENCIPIFMGSVNSL